jgi:4'-phosphopantetheinyl transferase
VWNIPSHNLHLREDEVHVWRVSLVVPEFTLDHLQVVLSQEEVTRAARFHFEKDRKRWIVGRGVLRILLGRYVNTYPSQLRFGSHAYGKPFLAFPSVSPPLEFNISHSHDLVLYAFTFTRQVGIDLEYKGASVDYEALAKVSFSPNEQALFRSLPDDVKQEAFFNCWTRKEAYIKARGKGLSIPLDQFDVSFIPGEPAALLQDREDPREMTRWTLQELLPGSNYAGAIAVEGTRWNLSCWQWQT